MKTVRIALSLLAIVAVAAIYSTGAFIPETNGMADTVAGLTVLNDAEMAQQVGGPWTSQLAAEANGSYASCAVDNCPDNTYSRTHARYRCVPCNTSWQYAFTSVVSPKVTTSWCDDFGVEGIRCDYKSTTTEWQYSCISFQGPC